MKKIFCSLLIVMIISSQLAMVAAAQEPSPELISGTTPVSAEIRAAIESWLAVSPPVNTPYYAVTYFQSGPLYDFVSLVALQLASPDEAWSMEDGDKAAWIGTVKVFTDGTVELYSSNQQSHQSGHLAKPSTAAGGGSYVSFPWQASKGVIFGPRGIHGEGDYGTSGMFAVDFVSGLDLGAGAASDKVYASDAGTIDYVCDDGTSVTVRTHNDTTDDYFIYAHLVDNASLAIDQDFSGGGFIGSLVHGSFDDTCGWAEQQDDHWHLHWMFTPASGAFKAESCILTFSDTKWHCGTSVIGTGQWIVGGGGTGSGHDDPIGSSGYEGTGNTNLEGSLWDYLIVGLAFIIDPFFKLVPEHQGLNFVYVIYNTMELFLRLLYVFTYGNINLIPVIIVLGFVVSFRGALFVVWIGAFTFKAVKSLFL